MKKIFITDWLEKYGGAERVVQAICESFQFDQYFAYIDLMPSEIKETVLGGDYKVNESRALKSFGKYFRLLMPFFPLIVKRLNCKSRNIPCDLIISSSWALSKGFKINGAKHICYLQARNFKYVWSEADLYFRGPLKLCSFVKPYLQKFDIQSAQNPDVLISNSNFVKEWTKAHYGRDSIVIYPPVDVDDFFISSTKEGYYIAIGRLEPYKRFDIIIDAFNKNGKKLIVLGSGSQLKRFKAQANSNISFPGFINKDELKGILSKSNGFVYAGSEDFGIVYVESLASGVPVIAYNGGAVTEIVEHGQDGVLFDSQDPEALNNAILLYEKNISDFNPINIKKRASRFSKQRFQKEFTQIVQKVCEGE